MNILSPAAAASATPLPLIPSSGILAAANLLLPHIERGACIDASLLRSVMEDAFGASDATGLWDWKAAYEACEVATVLFLRKYGKALFRKAASQSAVYGNRARLKSGVGRKAMRRRCELVERSFAHILDRGGMRRAWLRGRENVHKRYLIHVAGFNLGLLMRAIHGAGTPKEACDDRNALIFAYQTADVLLVTIVAAIHGEIATIIWRVAPEGS